MVVVDGVCGGCGRPYPVRAAADRVRAYGGVLLLDDTQALGLFGEGTDAAHPFGRGGGGSLRRAGVRFDDVVSVASLAKAFGAPVASIAGSAAIIERIGHRGGSMTYSSPPSAVDIAAADYALDRNAAEGDLLRRQLATRIRALRSRSAERGLRLADGRFPVQATTQVTVPVGRRLLRRLDARGVRAVLRRDCTGGNAIALVLTATNRLSDVTMAADELAAAWFAERCGGARCGVLS